LYEEKIPVATPGREIPVRHVRRGVLNWVHPCKKLNISGKAAASKTLVGNAWPVRLSDQQMQWFTSRGGQSTHTVHPKSVVGNRIMVSEHNVPIICTSLTAAFAVHALHRTIWCDGNGPHL